MSRIPNRSSQIASLNVGNVVSAGFRLYRDRFNLYFGLSLKALLWFFIPVYGWAKAFQIQAVISRHAFGELVEKPETVAAIQTQTNPRFWEFWIAQFLIWLIGVGVNMAVSIVSLFIIGIPSIFLMTALQGNQTAAIAIQLLQQIVNLISYVVYLWVYSHFFIAELPLALEENITSGNCISRSWELTKGFISRILSVVLVGGLITMPLWVLACTPLLLLIPIFSELSGASAPDPSVFLTILLVMFLMIALFAFVNTLMLPFWQSLKAVIYYDLRNQKEGLSLQLRDIPLDKRDEQ